MLYEDCSESPGSIINTPHFCVTLMIFYSLIFYLKLHQLKQCTSMDYVHEVLVNRLGGLSLPRKSVVRLTDRPEMTLDVYRGRKTTKQQSNFNG